MSPAPDTWWHPPTARANLGHGFQLSKGQGPSRSAERSLARRFDTRESGDTSLLKGTRRPLRNDAFPAQRTATRQHVGRRWTLCARSSGRARQRLHGKLMRAECQAAERQAAEQVAELQAASLETEQAAAAAGESGLQTALNPWGSGTRKRGRPTGTERADHAAAQAPQCQTHRW